MGVLTVLMIVALWMTAARLATIEGRSPGVWGGVAALAYIASLFVLPFWLGNALIVIAAVFVGMLILNVMGR